MKIAKEIGDRQGEANILGNIGIVFGKKGDLDEALKHFQEALHIHREVEDRQGEAGDLSNIGIVFVKKGELDEAKKNLQLSYNLFIELGLPHAVKIKTLLENLKK